MKLLTVEPQDLWFNFELKKLIPCTMLLQNDTDHFVAFKVKTTNPKKFSVRPNVGVLPPHSTSDVVVTMQAQAQVPPDMLSKDKFLIQSIIASDGTTAKDLTPDMFDKNLGHSVEATKLRILYNLPEEIVEDVLPAVSVDDDVTNHVQPFEEKKLKISCHLPKEIYEDASHAVSVDDHVASLMRTYKAMSKEVEANLQSLERLYDLLNTTIADLKRHGVEMPSV